MDTKGIGLLEAIGAGGLRAAIAASFDRPAIIDLANACRLKFPGRRARALDDKHLLDEIVKRFLEDEIARVAVMKALIKANEGYIARFAPMTPDELSSEVAGLDDREAGRALFALGDDPREIRLPEIAALLLRLGIEAPGPPPGTTGSPAEGAGRERRLIEEVDLLRQRLDRLEESRESQETLIDDLRRSEADLQQMLLSARRESHHLRKDVGRLEEEKGRLLEENARLAESAGAGGPAAEVVSRIDEIGTRIGQLSRDSRKISHDLEKIIASSQGGSEPVRPYIDALAASLAALRRELGGLRAERADDSRRTSKAIQDLAAEVNMTRSDLSQWRKSIAEPAPRRRGEPDRVGLFVDVQNMYYAARQLNARLDFGALMAAATRDRRLIRAIAYVVQNRDIDQSGFLAMLQQKNYEVRRKDLKIRHDGSSKGDWDMEMALDILRLADSLDVVVLVSGDGDFASLVTQIKTLGPRVEVYSFQGSTAKELIEAADRHVPIDEGFLIRMSPSV